VIVTAVSWFSPLVVDLVERERVSARAALVMLTRVSSAGELASARRAIASASARESRATGSADVSDGMSNSDRGALTPSVPC
jgi:hypothetical protein